MKTIAAISMMMLSGVALAAPPYATKELGTTVAEVHKKFPSTIEANLSTITKTRNVFTLLSNVEIIDLHKYYKKAKGNTTIIDQRVAAWGTASNKTRWAQAKAGTLKEVLPGDRPSPPPGSKKSIYSPTGIQHTNAIGPNIDYTLPEIYLSFRTTPGGVTSRAAALFETLNFMATRIAISYGAGYTIGTGIALILERYAPNTYDAIGGTVAIIVERIDDATSVESQEDLTVALAGLFGYQMPDISSGGNYYAAGSYSAAFGYYHWYPGGSVKYRALRPTVTVEPCDGDCR